MANGPARLTAKALTGLTMLLLTAPALSTTLAAAATSASTKTSTTASTGATSGATSTVPNPAPQADLALQSVMLAVPLPGLTGFSLVGPGATNGVLTSETLGSYSNDPAQVRKSFDQYSAESGFAGWIKTWQNHGASDVVVEIAIRFHDSAEATTNASAFISTLSQGLSGGNRTNLASIPGATAFSINEAATTAGTTVVPAQQVQAVVFSDGDYFVAIHTDSLTATGENPIAQGTGVALALQQFEELAPIVNPPRPKNAAPAHRAPAGGGTSALTVGIALLAAVALVIVGLAFMQRRRTDRAGATADSDSDSGAGSSSPAHREPVSTSARRHRQSAGVGASTAGAPSDASSASTFRSRSRPRSVPRPTRNGARAGAGAGAKTGANGASGAGAVPSGDHLVGAGASKRSTSVSERLSAARDRHPSAAVALANNRPPESVAGWYPDPSDTEHKRIRFWDGAGWTAHVAEPET